MNVCSVYTIARSNCLLPLQPPTYLPPQKNARRIALEGVRSNEPRIIREQLVQEGGAAPVVTHDEDGWVVDGHLGGWVCGWVGG